jgi:F420-dependent oxidoreductase-like protein
MEIAIMIEGQNGLNWDRWQRIARAVEDLGFADLYRSDHFTNAKPPDLDSLELWTSLTWLATQTQRIVFGPLVTPLSFRHPTLTARMAAAVDELSKGRMILGLGAGWQEREHTNFGFDLLDVSDRFDRFEEGLEVISRLLQSDEPVHFSGKYYHLQEAILLPRPQRPGGPPILIGGGGPVRTLPLVARFAEEWNSPPVSDMEFNKLNQRLDELLIARGRSPQSVRRSMMTGTIFGKNEAEVDRKVESRTAGKRTADQLREAGYAVGTASRMVDLLNAKAEVGVQKVMLQWLDLDDIDGLEAMAHGLLPHFPSQPEARQ